MSSEERQARLDAWEALLKRLNREAALDGAIAFASPKRRRTVDERIEAGVRSWAARRGR